MITWGISANSHDAALAVFVDNQLEFASHSERFSRIKNDPDLNSKLIEYAYHFGNPNQIIWYEKPWLKSLRQIKAGQGLVNNNIKKYLKQYDLNVVIKTVYHHHSHAAAGYYTSGFDKAVIVVIDAIGEFDTITFWIGEGNKLKKIYSQQYPHSVGLWYSAMTQRIGLKPNEEEYILMGMAGYGTSYKLAKRISDDFILDYDTCTFKNNLHRGCRNWAPDLNIDDIFDIAAGTQLVYEKLFKKILYRAKNLTDCNNLVLMGGCALNCTANNLAFELFEQVWIMPNPGDAGSAVGAVLAHKKIHIPWTDAYLGYEIKNKTSPNDVIDYLLLNKICGVAQGKAEYGPRALGNRSLLADPRGSNIKDRVNEIKQRQKFRPFAPVILEEYANQYFKIRGKPQHHRYMQFTSKCRFPDLFPAIIHVDETSRVQTVPKNNSYIRQLLELWHSKTQCPMLLNTSLNIKGQPIVNDREDAEQFEKLYNVKVFT
jgi:carbamoyltransferase